MNKAIIIHDIDISECGNYDMDNNFTCDGSFCKCEELPNCQFKQLRRKEQLIQRLETKLIAYKEAIKEIKEIAEYCMDEVDQENSPLYSILEIIKEIKNEE